MYLSIEEMVAMPEFKKLSVSEDGQMLAYEKKSTDWKRDSFVSQVWIVKSKGAIMFPLTIGPITSSQPVWSKDSLKIAFLSVVQKNGKNTEQVFVHHFDTNKTIQVTDEDVSIENMKWRFDDDGLYILKKNKAESIIEARKTSGEGFEKVDKEFTYKELYYVALVEKEKPLKLFKEPIHIIDFDVSPVSNHLVCNAAKTPHMNDAMNQQIFITTVEQQEPIPLPLSDLQYGHVLFSPDGKSICYRVFQGERSRFANTSLEIFNLETKKRKIVSTGIDEWVTPIRWTEQGILFTWQDRTAFRLGFVCEEGEVNRYDRAKDEVISLATTNQEGSSLAYCLQRKDNATTLYWNEQIIDSKEPYYYKKQRSEKEIVTWTNEVGMAIEGVLSKPTSFNPNKKYPLLIVIHGGPQSASIPVPYEKRIEPVEAFIEKGFLVLEPNYRGSSGYGESFRKANYCSLGTGDLEDVLAGIAFLEGRGIVDSNRIGIIGWSQGGFIAAFAALACDRFKVACVGAGISNWESYFFNTDIPSFGEAYFGGSPFEKLTSYQIASPITYLNTNKTIAPILIQHGSNDQRVPIANAHELYYGLKFKQADVEFIRYNGMGHIPTKPKQFKAVLTQQYQWIVKHL
ncbi:prolyl oligopeptidase family serine peptidase [Alkalihalobacillus sp. LMS6]|uniref:S9 family peptidase n=1 Tax=Alkalihalobacillus sp. LMS6 TaxID=2924034 RepID=UPI0020D0C57D|nr:prolyl oligopeptidase family serine peptidase [Alkalihalobacillus sp. LMS6]UTR07773.1 prolyl oligopeptidase family serine peptidase [Alkalihalobacillus sp. LMS6]